MAPNDAEGPKNFKDVLLITQLCHFPIFFVSFGLSVDPDNLQLEWTQTLVYQHYILYICLFFFVFAGIIGLKILLEVLTKPEPLTKCRRDLSIGYGGMIICGIIPQVLKVILMENVKDLLAFSAICAVSNFLFLGLFVLEHHQNYGTSKKASKEICAGILRFIMMILHLAITGYFLKRFVRGIYSKKQTENTEKLIFLYTGCYISCTAEFAVVLAGWIRLKDRPQLPPGEGYILPVVDTVAPMREMYRDLHRSLGYTAISDSNLCEIETCRFYTTVHQESQHIVRVTVPTVPTEQEQEETTGNSTSGTECNICMLRYTPTTVIPRMLVGCGHTVCQECIQKIPRQDILSVLCPFCRKPTSLPDNLPNRLPKNYAILDIIHNLEK
ncbi:hypothetical protein GCK72_011351 [Caenorhabditis remanei]|uniref:RING-type domain-containing protein n=1 Tax=Caenorhabditis remanei TaxID=31234 RepID=A0A6A5H884_CAERE|nr:hypothetical protein GCK72_011351 [Caenorhabditis remanei]KAF1763086.1 hypothetical protein GCK72_011351 [Caenorhabditis remanei]